MKTKEKPELMAPAGDWIMLRAAVERGADAVYLGVDNLNMRVKAQNFKLDELDEVVGYCHDKNVKVYLTVNIVLKDSELDEVENVLRRAKETGVDMVICWDFAVIDKCRQLDIPFCISTQASAANTGAVKFFEKLGAARVVLARECSLDEIREIKKNTDIEIETFIHGAMCVAVSGRCFLSHHIFDKSANRGECIQPCRREFKIYDTATKESLYLGEDYVMSAKDLSTIEILDELIEAGIDSFKIEGRKRSPEYVAKAVEVYRKAIDMYYEGKLTNDKKTEFAAELEKVFNRGFSTGFYHKRPAGDEFADVEGSSAGERKRYIGKVIDYFKIPQVAHVKIEAHPLKSGDKIIITGKTTGMLELKTDTILRDDKEVLQAAQGDDVTFKCSTLVRRNDKVYVIEDKA